MTTSIPPPPPPPHRPPPVMLRPKTLLKQRSWSPETDYEESWQRRKSLSRDRRNHRKTLGVTDEDIDELRGFLDLGMAFGDDCPNGGNDSKRLSEALPALDLYLAVRRDFRGSIAGGGSPASDSSSASDASPAESPLSIFAISPSESQEARRAGIKRWARLVALAARDCC